MASLADFTQTDFTYDSLTLPVYRRGHGPGVVIMPEVPGITPALIGFAGRVVDAGFTVVMPSLFGTAGRPPSLAYAASVSLKLCLSREFRLLATRAASPITDWLRALARALHDELGGKGVGAIGMCVTGNFALALMVDPWIMAPVLSQPSLPLGFTRGQREAVHTSDEGLVEAKHRAARGVDVLALRFTEDPLCPGERFARLRQELGSAFEAIEIDSSFGNAHGISRLAHSVLTGDLVDEAGHPTREALDRVLRFLEKLKPD